MGRSHFQCHHQLQSLLVSPSTHAHMVATVAARLTATARMATTSIGGKFALEVLSTESKAGAAMVPGSVPVAVMEAVRARGPAFGALTRCMSARVPLYQFNGRGGNGGGSHWLDCGSGFKVTGYQLRCGSLVDKVRF